MIPGPSALLGVRLSDARHQLYVGRGPELAQIADALGAESLPFHVAHIYGPGGIGKTAFLDEVAYLGAEAGVAVARLDGRDVAPTPDGFAAAAERALAEAERGGDTRRLLLVDTYERIQSLDGWMRRTFVPSLRDSDLIVIAGRRRPSHQWRAEWRGEMLQISLRNLSRDESRDYLAARGVPDNALAAVLAFTHGHPLALTLVAEWMRQQGEVAADAFDPAQAPDLVGDLLSRFVSSLPTPAHRAALEGASVVRSLTVPLLRALLEPGQDPDALFGWLRRLTFVETDAAGLRLHDVVRETIEADLRWRDAQRHEVLHVRARQYYSARLRDAEDEDERRRALADYVDLYRNNPVVQPLLQRLNQARAGAEIRGSGPLRDGDGDAIRAIVARHQGEAEAQAVAGWLARRPQAAEVYVAADGSVAGFLLTLHLEDLAAAERQADPVTAAAWAGVGSQLREAERALLFRSWMDAEAGQGVSVVQSLVFARTVEHYLTTPRLATSILLTSEPATWEVVLQFAGLHRWPEAEASGRSAPMAAFGKDWRASPPSAWLDAIAERTPSQAPPPDPADTLVVLSEDAFAEAVRDALKAYALPHRLAESPLLRARLVREREGEPVEVLQRLVDEAAAQLDLTPRERPYFQTLDLTYFRPAPTQAVAAERLDLPFSTYRRHLNRGIEHVTAFLWRLETGDDGGESPAG